MSIASSSLLNSKVAAALIGRSVYTLQRARCDRPDLRMPPHVRIGTRTIRYDLDALLAWARYREVHLHWRDLPLRWALPAVRAHQRAGLPLPSDLRLRVALTERQGGERRSPK